MEKELLLPEIRDLLHEKKLKELKEFITELHPSEIADIIEELEEREGAILFRLLPKDLAAEVFSEFEPGKQEEILKQLSDNQIKRLILELEPDDRTALLEELPGKITRNLLNLLPPEERKQSIEILAYPENSVGRLITPEYVAVKPQWTVRQALQHIKKFGKDAETIDVVYVVDDNWKLLDDIPIRKFILSDPEEKVSSLMDEKVVSISAYEDQEEAVKLVKQYNLIALPVTDSDGTLIGIVTVDDLIDVMEEEETEDFRKIGGVEPTSHLNVITDVGEASIFELYRSRISWLVILLFMDIITGGIIGIFKETLTKYIVLATFLPVLIDTSGNAGSQAATLMVRAIALGDVKLNDWVKLIGKELLVSASLGITMGIGISFMGFVRGGSKVAFVVSSAMITNVVIGSLIGLSLPFLFTKFKKDPATASTPLITTVADIVGTFIYFLFATKFLI